MLENFRTYKLAVELFRECERLQLRGEIRDQLHRASLSAALNLAEGSGKPSRAERKRFYGIAMGSIRETQAVLDILGQVTLSKKADQLGAMTFCLIRSSS